MEFFVWLYMQEIYIWLAPLLLYVLASIMEIFLSAHPPPPHTHTHTHTHTYLPYFLLLRASRNLKLAILFKIYYLICYQIKLYYKEYKF